MTETPDTLILDSALDIETKSAEADAIKLEGIDIKEGITEKEIIEEEIIEEEIVQHIPVIEVVDPYPRKEYPVGLAADMKINVRCPEGCDLGGGAILIGDEEDTIIAEQRLLDFAEGEGKNTTGSFSVQIPKEPGNYTWTIVFYPKKGEPAASDSAGELTNDDSKDALTADAFTDTSGFLAEVDETAVSVPESTFEETAPAEPTNEETQSNLHAIVQADFAFKAVQHITGMSIWRDSRNPVPTGNDYVLNVGVACVSGCSLFGQKVSISHEGAVLATVETNTAKVYDGEAGVYVTVEETDESIAPREKLYCTQVPLTAPNEVGRFKLVCYIEPEGLGLAHSSNTCNYNLTTSKHAQCRLDITTISDESLLGGPIEKPAKCVDLIVCPNGSYASYLRTDEEGKASIDVPWGEINIEANEVDHKQTVVDVTIPEGQEAYELTMYVPYWPSGIA